MITELTREQEARLAVYRNEGIAIGLATGPEFDESLVLSLINQCRAPYNLPSFSRAQMTIYDSPITARLQEKDIAAHNAFYGQHDINWLQFYMSFRNEIGLVQETELIVPLFELTKHIGWFWMNEERVIVTRRPKSCHMINKANNVKVLHNPTGLALEYADGTGVYSLNGIRIPKSYQYIITDRQNLTAEKVLSIKNTEIRTEAMKLLGLEQFYASLNKTVIEHKVYDNRPGLEYDLVKFSLDEGQNYRIYLKGTCPSSGKGFFEAVHPDCKTVDQALAWREEGSIDIPYVMPVERT